MNGKETLRINLVGLGTQSVAMESLLDGIPADVRLSQGASRARTSALDFQTPLVLDGAESAEIAARRIRELGLVDILSDRIASGASLLVCAHAALAMASGRLKGSIRGLGLVPAELLRVPGIPVCGSRRIAGHMSNRAWFGHEYLFVPVNGDWSVRLLPTGLLAAGGARICAFDPARSAGFGRAFVMNWFNQARQQREEAA